MTLLAAVAVPLALAGILGAVSATLARRMPPATAVRLLVVGAVVTAAAGGFGLAVTAFSAAAQNTEVAQLGHWSTRVLRQLADIPTPLGIAAGIAAVLLLVAALRRVAMTMRLIWAADATCRHLGQDVGRLVVVDDDHPEAYAVQGLRGRVVVSTGMLAALTPAERRVLFAHESSHLANRHTLLIQLADIAAAANPLLRPVARVVREGVERWADEDAADHVGDRCLAARALARAALATQAAAPRTTAAALAITGGSVAARASALLRPAPTARRALTAALVVATLAAGASALVTEHVTEHNFECAAHTAVCGR